MVKCNRCQWKGDEENLKLIDTWLDDDAWGAGNSRITEAVCPSCGGEDLEDGYRCIFCDCFVLEGKICDCEED